MDATAELILRYLRRRWWRDVLDLLDDSTDERLAFDDLELVNDIDELERAVGKGALEKWAIEALARSEALPDEIAALETEPPRARAFVAIVAASLAFALRTDRSLAALARRASIKPSLEPAVVGSLLVRARSARDARAIIEAALPPGPCEPALAAVVEPAPIAASAVVHVHARDREVEAALEHVFGKKGLVPVVWIARVASDSGRRLIVGRTRGGWTSVIAPSGVERALAAELARAKDVRATAWVHVDPARSARDFEIREGANVVLDTAKLTARVGVPTDDDVLGALRARGVAIYDPAADEQPSLRWEDYSPVEGAPVSPSALKALKVTGLAFAEKGAVAENEKARAKARAKRRHRERS
jgi:hypothetical protein